jgi:hypothetical protein
MPYTLYKTNGIKLTTVDDGSLNLTTDLQLVGKNYAGYGQVVNENLVKLLENFSNTSSPTKPLPGQLWFDSLNKKLKVYNGTKWNQLLTTSVSSSRPTDVNNGEFWFDTSTQKLYFKYNDVFILIGPGSASGSFTGGTTVTTGGISTSQVLSSINVVYDVIKLAINDTVTAIVSPYSFKVDSTDPLVTQHTTVTNGISLLGADPVTGISSNNNTYFWGTAADSKRLAGKLSTEYLLSTDLNLAAENITSLGKITFISSGSPSTSGTIEGAWQLSVGSTLQATYSDLAERYHADTVYDPGTVLVIGGDKEVTTTEVRANVSIAGVVSTDPAFKMNSEAGSDATHPYIALKGRIPCKVVGPITKGDRLVSSSKAGYAEAFQPGDDQSAVIGKALENFEGSFGVIEIKV